MKFKGQEPRVIIPEWEANVRSLNKLETVFVMEGGRYSPNELLGRPFTKLLFAIFQHFNLESLSSGEYLVDKLS